MQKGNTEDVSEKQSAKNNFSDFRSLSPFPVSTYQKRKNVLHLYYKSQQKVDDFCISIDIICLT